MAKPSWPVEVAALSPVACGSVLWRSDDRLALTVIVKATFGLVHGGSARLVAPSEILRRDQHHDKSPTASLEAAAETAPSIPTAGVVLVGHAYAPAGHAIPAAAARLALFRERAILDKTVHVFGDRHPSAPGRPEPFQRMPIRYERAYGGPRFGPNPVGTGLEPGTPLPNIVDPNEPERPAGFGPIAPRWPLRRRLLDPPARARLDEPIPDLPRGFPFAYFQAAPADQQIDALRGDEWILLDGLHPALSRVQTRLPGGRALARYRFESGPGPRALQPIELVADTLAIDSDRQTCAVVWRGCIAVGSSTDALSGLRVFAGIELPGMAVTWPAELPAEPFEIDDEETVARDDRDAEGAEIEDEETAAPDALSASRPATPFASAARAKAEGTAVISLDALSASRPAVPFVPGPSTIATSTSQPVVPARREGEEATAALPLSALGLRPQVTPFDEGSLDGPLPFVAAAPEPPPAAPPAASTAGDAARWFHDVPRPGAEPSPEPRGPEPPAPKRRNEGIPIVISGPLTAATVAWQIRPPNDSITVIVKGTFDLVPDGRARIREEPDPPSGDVYFDDDPEKSVVYASDFAVRKPKADVTARGHAHAPGGSSPAMAVSFRFGKDGRSFHRVLDVFGDRRWQKGVIALAPTDPAPFRSIPLTWERAFGGPGYDKNPIGVGYRAAAGEDGTARLPNVELHGKLVTSPSDTPDPAGFGPIPGAFPDRWSKLGTYDARWFKLRWPYFPEDFDWAFFQSAPVRQRLDFLDGDEPFEIVGMHPDHPALRGELPALRAHAYAELTREAGGGFKEIALSLDTADFDMDSLTLRLVWRGFLEVSDEDAPEIQDIFVMATDLAAPKPTLDEARARYLAAIAPREPPPATGEPEVVANDVDEEPEEEDPSARIEAELVAAEETLRADLRAAGVPDDAPMEPPPPPDPQAIAASLRELGASEEDVAELLLAMKPPEDEPDEIPPPDPDLRARVVAMLAAGEPFDGMDLAGADLRDLDFSGRSLAGARLLGANLGGASFAGASLAGAQMERADLTDANLAEADLTEADLTSAALERAKLDGATLDLADLGSASGKGASFAGAKGERAVFAGGTWDEARFDGAALPRADFTGASLSHASFADAAIEDARLYDARGGDVVFDRAKMARVRAEGATLLRGSFKDVDAEGSIWEAALLDESSFRGAILVGASFIRASCRMSSFGEADLTDARLRRAKLAGASFVKANLMRAQLERADLTIADLRGANLHAAGLWKTQRQDAKLDGAILTKSTLARRS